VEVVVLAVESKGLSIGYLDEEDRVLWVVKKVDIEIGEGEVHCLVGESGCGKTTLGNSIAGVLPPYSVTRGELIIYGRRVIKDDLRFYEGVRGKLTSYIPQNPGSSLSPYMRIWDQFWRVLREQGLDERFAKERATGILKTLNLDRDVLEHYPHELSGGMQQRVAIGLSLATGAKVIVADEPTSSVDAHLKLQLMRLFKDVRNTYGVTIVLITHDILLAGKVCDRISVMYAGEIVEEGDSMSVLTRPLHPYTKLLVGVVPVLGFKKKLASIPGEPPKPGFLRDGCYFYERCPFRDAICLNHVETQIIDGRRVKCRKPLVDKITS
jgi:oligopeptide/dipeptide ABC transporter ATP-binding protein